MIKTQISDVQLLARYNDAMARLQEGQITSAHAAFSTLAQQYPNTPEIWFQLHAIELEVGRPYSAAQKIERATRLRPNDAYIQSKMAELGLLIGQPAVSIEIYKALAKAHPQDPEYALRLVDAHNAAGDTDKALDLARKSLKKWPKSGKVCAAIFRMQTVTTAANPVFRRAMRLWSHPGPMTEDKVSLGFGLAKAYEDLQDYDQMFSVLGRVNTHLAQTHPFDPKANDEALSVHLDAMPAAKIERFGSSDFRPVFIVGLPRSGTTLFDKILESHPDVSSAGEMSASAWLFRRFFLKGGSVLSPERGDLSKIDDFAAQYMASAMETAQSQDPVIIDKSMGFEFSLGWFATAFPKAKFIVVRRNPCDMATSIYKNQFVAGTYAFSSRLDHIAAVTNAFNRAIDHWRSRVDLTEISYDDLVSHPEANIPALVEAAGLPWNDACLEHHKRKSTVLTLSVNQARKPIYKNSSGAWAQYETHLRPFIEACEELN